MAEKKTKAKKETKFVPFEEQNVVHPLKLFFSIVPAGQAEAIVKIMEKLGASCSFIASGEGTGANMLPGLVYDPKKQLVYTFIREDKAPEVCKALRERYTTSKAARGISFSVKLTSVAGVSVYKFLTNTRRVKKVK